MNLLRIFLLTLCLALLTAPPDVDAARRPYRWPLQPRPQVVTPYDPPAQRWQSGHRGVDLAAAVGSPVLAAGSGTVNFAGDVGGKPVVSIRHADGLLTTYEPVEASVRAGQTVARGEVIGRLAAGHDGCPSACLHWGARRGAGSSAQYVNPLSLVGAVRVRLKPVQPVS
ncbi:M23 family metallopeptidase [Gordonia sp. TBRC 11910]|uniref:M23 family metallopeptidase n=2 Tax=Gordonia asplenii TaxID=2725283 RepID=A0A848KTC2_9ACTN|nr:M23 family metallopeptidase [Gordonia asplenii]